MSAAADGDAVRIGLISDTHGWLDPAVAAHFRGVDLIVHAGDVGDAAVLAGLAAVAPVMAVRGNIDGGALADLPVHAVRDVRGVRVAALHIAGAPGRPNAAARALIVAERPDLLVVGHSHVVGFSRHGATMVVNPGAAGRHGFHDHRTAFVLERSGGEWQAWRIDLGPRGRPR